MKKFFQHTAYFIAYSIWWFLSLLPFWALYLLSDGLYLLMSHVVRYRHRVIWHNLRTSFPEKSEDELRQIEKNFYKWFCDYIVETVKLITMSKEQLLKRMTFTGVEKLNQYAAEGRSVGVYLGHLGNWEWITSPFRKRIFRPTFPLCSRAKRCLLHPYARVVTQDFRVQESQKARHCRLHFRPNTLLVEHSSLANFPPS